MDDISEVHRRSEFHNQEFHGFLKLKQENKDKTAIVVGCLECEKIKSPVRKFGNN